MTTKNNQEQTTYHESNGKIVSRLRRIADSNSGVSYTLYEAADRLEALQRENEELKRTYVKQDYFISHS